MLLKRALPILFVLISFSRGFDARGQNVRFEFDRTPLAEAVEEYKRQTGIDVVYSPDLIRSLRSQCVYSGADPLTALECIVRSSGLEIRVINDRQYVLVPHEGGEAGGRARTGTITGFILDAETGESLYGANISLPGLRAGTTSNEAGYFALPSIPLGAHRLRVSYLGYLMRDTTLTVSKAPYTLRLHPTSITLNDVVVEREYVGRADLAVLPGLISIPVRRLEQLPPTFGGRDVLEALGWMPGIQRAGEATGGLVVRGSGPDQNLFLIDGAPIYHPWHAFSLISTFQTETFKDLKFYRGSFPAEYGGRLSAVLDAELRDGQHAEPSVLASLNALNARFLIESAIGSNSSFMLSGRRSYIDKLIGRQHPVSDDSGRRDTLRTGYFFYDWSAKFSYAPNASSRLSFSYYSGRDDLDLRLPFDLSLDFSSWLKPADLFFEVDQNWGNSLYSARYQRLLSDRVFISGSVFNSEYSAREGTRIHPTRSASVTSDYSVTLRDIGFRMDADYFPSLNHQIRTGFTVVRHQFKSTIDALVTYSPSLKEVLVDGGDVRTTELAVYLQDLWKPSERMQVLAGLRLSHFGRGQFTRLSPRMSLEFEVDPRWLILRGSVTSQVQYLQRIRDRYSFLYDLVSSRWIPSGSTVAPSRSLQVVVGGESDLSEWLHLTVEGYARSGRGVILPRDDFQSKNGLLGPGIDISTLLGQYTQGREYSYGVEMGSDIQLQNWRILLSYTGGRTKNRTVDLEDNAYRPSRFDIPRSFSAVAQRTLGKFDFSVSTIWRAGYPTTVPVSRYALVDHVSGQVSYYYHTPVVNNGRLPAYFRTDVGMGFRFGFLEASWSARIQVYNVFNRRNVISRTYDPSRQSFSPRDTRGLPLLPLFELEMQL